ncbi:hypothetical protein H5410_019656 [Solanum commersonii]|uniref:Uncharacterized protein n=1 Tax=Solanum commersonii TaxID=4109 RepID=A0A9J5Z8Y9_SOLCO|nr:hypothetical protein H5410_019656 [Solanum commersonii]
MNLEFWQELAARVSKFQGIQALVNLRCQNKYLLVAINIATIGDFSGELVATALRSLLKSFCFNRKVTQ